MNVNIESLNMLKSKIDEAKIKLENVQDETKESLKEKIIETKGNLNATRQNYELWAQEKESEVFSESLKMKMSLQSKFDEIKSKIESKNFEHKKQKQRAKADKALEQAEHAAAFAIWSIEEAILAYLEAVEVESEYIDEHESESYS